MLGFGKLKFTGAHPVRDRLYIKSFLVTQPMVSPAGLFAFQRAPDAVWVGALAGMFVIEILAPFGLFFVGAPRIAAGLLIASLMVGIQLSGNCEYGGKRSGALNDP